MRAESQKKLRAFDAGYAGLVSAAQQSILSAIFVPTAPVPVVFHVPGGTSAVKAGRALADGLPPATTPTSANWPHDAV